MIFSVVFVAVFVSKKCLSVCVQATMDYDSLIYSHIANYYDDLVSFLEFNAKVLDYLQIKVLSTKLFIL